MGLPANALGFSQAVQLCHDLPGLKIDHTDAIVASKQRSSSFGRDGALQSDAPAPFCPRAHRERTEHAVTTRVLWRGAACLTAG
jgi:hypothetical protein